MALAHGVAFGQVPGGASSANPAVATQRIEKISAPLPAVQRTVGPSVVENAFPIDQATPGDPTKFYVKKIVFEGGAKLPKDRLDRLAAEYSGREVTLGQLHILARRVRVLARNKGYLVADAVVPQQTIDDGIVKVKISEGKYGKTTVRGQKHYHEWFVRRLFSPATDGQVVYGPDLYRSLLVLNEYPDLAVQAQFQPGKAPGTTDVVLNVKDARPLHYSVDYNNFGNRLVGRNRIGATAYVGNTLTDGDEILLRAVDSWPGRSHIFVNAGYTAPVTRQGTKVGFQFADAETHVRGGALTALDIRGDANIYSLVATHPLKRTFTDVQNLSASFSAKTVKNFFFGNTLTSRDDLRVVTLGWDGSRGDRGGRTIHSVVVSKGLDDAFGGNKNGDPLSSRVGSGNDFAKLNVDVLRNQDLKNNRYLLVRGGFQLATDPLVTAEQYGIGGPDSVRGFIQSEALGDEGYNISAEYRHQIWRSKDQQDVVQGVAFIDHGHVELSLPQVGERRERDLTGIGLGLRGAMGLKTTLRLDVGFPVSVDRNVDGDEAVLYAQAAHRF